jgi:hypothetical protein
MLVALRILSILLLLFNGIGALYGSFKFITDPSGASLGMTLSLLKYSPFTNYLTPGIVLLVANGILSFVVIALVIFKTNFYPLAIIAEGCILFGWISIQVIMLRTVAGLHITLWTVSVLLILSGIALNRKLLLKK